MTVLHFLHYDKAAMKRAQTESSVNFKLQNKYHLVLFSVPENRFVTRLTVNILYLERLETCQNGINLGFLNTKYLRTLNKIMEIP